MQDLSKTKEISEEVKRLMDEHARLVQAVQSSADDNWSLAQRSPLQFVPSVVTDSTTLSEQQ